jgi:hypothetical protein
MVTHSPTSMLVDMDALEESAKQLLAEREGTDLFINFTILCFD